VLVIAVSHLIATMMPNPRDLSQAGRFSRARVVVWRGLSLESIAA
jgi:hypothetical protein